MRYLIQFADKTTKRVSEAEGKAALMAWGSGRPVLIRGAGIAHHLISAIKPFNTDWYDADSVEVEMRREVEHLPVSEQHRITSDSKLLGFTEARRKKEVTSGFTKISKVQ